MTAPEEKPNEQDEAKKRAIKRIGAAVALAAVAAVGLTLLSHSNKPAPQPQQTVLPAVTPPLPAQTASSVEPTEPPQAISAVVETLPEKDEPPTTAPPPPPQVINNQKVTEATAKPTKTQKASREPEVSTAPTLIPATPDKNIKQRSAAEPTPATRETAAKASEAAARVAEAKKLPEASPPPMPIKPPVAEKSPPLPQMISSGGGGGAGGKGYAVQLGVFKDLTNALQMQEKLTQQGIQSYTETKLNVGPFKNKAEAEQAMAKLKGLGISAMLVPLK